MNVKGKGLPHQAVPRPSSGSSVTAAPAPRAQCSLVQGSSFSCSQASLQPLPGLPERTKALANEKAATTPRLDARSTERLPALRKTQQQLSNFNFKVQLPNFKVQLPLQSFGMAAVALPFSAVWRQGKEGWQQNVASPSQKHSHAFS